MTPDRHGRAYRLKREEGAAAGVRRIAHGRVDKAAKRLAQSSDGDADFAESIHGVRKDLKKVRALLRLVRDELGAQRFRVENRRFRDAGRLLSESRDAEVKLATLRALGAHLGDDFPAAQSLTWAAALEADRAEIAEAGRGELEGRLGEAATAIESAAGRIEAWPLKTDGWRLLEPGLNRTYRAGREALAAARAEASAENVHDFRKRSKDLWYQLRLLHDAWPGLLAASAKQVHELTDLLGDHHDLAVLAEDLEGRAGIVAEREAFFSSIEKRQAELAAGALGLGERIYAEQPKAFRRRLRAYWRVWRG